LNDAGPFDAVRMVAPVLRVADLAASVEWYTERFGLEPLYVSPPGAEDPIASFRLGGPLILWQLPDGVARDRTDNDRNSHVVVVVDTDLAPVRDRLAAAGVEVGAVRPGSDNELFDVFDPDGNRFEISRPAPEFR